MTLDFHYLGCSCWSRPRSKCLATIGRLWDRRHRSIYKLKFEFDFWDWKLLLTYWARKFVRRRNANGFIWNELTNDRVRPAFGVAQNRHFSLLQEWIGRDRGSSYFNRWPRWPIHLTANNRETTNTNNSAIVLLLTTTTTNNGSTNRYSPSTSGHRNTSNGLYNTISLSFYYRTATDGSSRPSPWCTRSVISPRSINGPNA